MTAWQQVANRYSSSKLRFAGAAAGFVLLLGGGLFGFQQWQLNNLRSQWLEISPKVKDLEKVQGQIHQFRPWYDDYLGALSILRQLTSAFPESGDVTAKTVEIRDLTTVTCTGTAANNNALLKVTGNLRGSKNVQDVKVDIIRGRSPMQFTFGFRWLEGGRS